MKALIFANGKRKDGVMVRRALLHAAGAHIIAADGGAWIARHYGLTPQVIIGDLDSLSPDDERSLETAGADIQRHPAEKNETDLELALLYAAQQGATWIRVIGAIGGRFDQMLANVYLLGLPQLVNCDVALVAGKQIIFLMRPGTHHLSGEAGDTVSLIPVSGDVSGITTHNLRYTLDNETLFFGPARGISNLMADTTAQVTLDNGLLLCVYTEGRA